VPGTGLRKLTDEQAVEARELFANKVMGEVELSRRFKMHRITMRSLLKGRTYKSAGGPLAERNPDRTAVTDAQAVEIRNLRAGKAKLKDLAWLYETALSNVHLIVTGQSHKDAGGPIQPIEQPLEDSTVLEIRNMRALGYGYAELSIEYGKSEVALRSICSGKSFPHVGGPLSGGSK
jgi:hypothetical protein